MHTQTFLRPMTIMLAALALLFSSLGGQALAQAFDLSGEVTLKPELSAHLLRGGMLFVYVRQYDPALDDQTRSKPIAVWRIADPSFPQAFQITEKNLLSQEEPPKGELIMMAKYSPISHAIQRAGAIYGLGEQAHTLERLQKQALHLELNQQFE